MFSLAGSYATLGLIALCAGVVIEQRATENITDDAFFYGQSPPVYPSRESSILPCIFIFSS